MITAFAEQQNTLSTSKAVWTSALQNQYPVALWRLPHTSAIHLMVDLSGKAAHTTIDLEELPTGFAFSPFNNFSGTGSLFIKGDIHYTIRNGQFTEESVLGQNNQFLLLEQQEKFRKRVDNTLNRSENPIHTEVIYTENLQQQANKKHFEQLVAKAIQHINQGVFQKVVLSRTKEIELLSNADIVHTFLNLCNRYPGAFASLVFIPEVGIWIGASPETLISVDKQGIFRTVSLAGTQKYIENTLVNQAVWTHKEIEEQALVSRYIVNCFKKIRLREYDEEGPRTVIAGNLMHLRTDFMVDTQAVAFPQLGTVMLGLLHPTSAVCGMPKEAALQFIVENEKHSRAFYSGFLGPVNVAEETHLFVNLRCMHYMEQKALLYAGAGITAHSDPQKEWIETELKCRTLLDALK